ncbi:hypothetical protein BKA65DRAFT_589790 [Rhexocercosporidium sp. MPI-PUGE-AT-0058]|nr:hypothetical protein BKA65DRAFT_589790 [Rhexocercosporidium sp. MPI-PUGE-AT-0058]
MMPKNKINLNSLPLGDLPDGGLITAQGDKLTIRDRVIIHETAENGKKVVKLYRQDDGPQQIQPAPVSQQQQGIKRYGSPLPAKPSKKRNKSSNNNQQQITADQKRRQQEISAERKRTSEELKACAAERQAINELRASDPNHPDIGLRLALNKKRTFEVEKRARENGILRRALNSELNLKNENGGDWEGQDVEDGLMGFMGFEQPYNSFGQPYMQSHTTMFNENNSDPNMFGWGTYNSYAPGFQDQFQQSYVGAPGSQSHTQRFFQQNESPLQYQDAITDALPENKIHPSRLTLLNSNTPMPERCSTEPKVLMKVTGENMVPLARSRMGGMSIKEKLKQEPEIPMSENAQEDVPCDRDAHVNSWENLKREYGQVIKKEAIPGFTPWIMPNETSRSDEATAWLDANIPPPVEKTRNGSDLVQLSGDMVEGLCVRDSAPEGAHDEKVIIKLGLQLYQDVDTTQVPPSESALPAEEVYAENIAVKQDPDAVHANTAEEHELHVFIKQEPTVEHGRISQDYQDKNVIIKQEPDTQHQSATENLRKKNVDTAYERTEHEERSMPIGAPIERKKEGMEFPKERSPTERALGELSVNTVIVRREENDEDKD